MNKWTRGIGFKGDLRFFIDDASGRVAVADQSGVYPEQTDDGILWVDADRPVRISTDRLTIPVIKDRDNNGYHCAVSIRNAEACVEFLAQHYEQLAISTADVHVGIESDWHTTVLRDHLRRVRDAAPRPERNPTAQRPRNQRETSELAARLVAEIQAEEAEVFRGVDNRHED